MSLYLHWKQNENPYFWRFLILFLTWYLNQFLIFLYEQNITLRQAFANHTEQLHQDRGKMLWPTIMYDPEVLDAASDYSVYFLSGCWLVVLRCWLELHPYMWKVIPTYVSIKGVIVYPYKYRLLNCFSKAMPLPTHNAEVVQYGTMSAVDWWPHVCKYMGKRVTNLPSYHITQPQHCKQGGE